MKQTLLKFLKVFLIITWVLVFLLLLVGIFLWLDWPWWVGLFIVVGLLGLFVGLVFLKKIWVRRREERFVGQIVEQDEARLKSLGDKERERSKELQGRWKEAIETLRRSHLKKRGNPLYVLPWYQVIGESGSGKTTAIQGARLSSPFAEGNLASGISGTKNCDWWFFEQAIIIDTAGRYAIPIDEGQDKEEWQRFLSLLSKYRRKEPLNGLIVTVSADKLLEADSKNLEEDGLSIRRRVDELMLALGAKFPVHVMVTKCDLIQGMTQFCDHIPENALSQAMGFVNQDLSQGALSFQARAFESIGERLRDLRLLLLHHIDSERTEPGLLLFPEEFEKLRVGLDSFIQGAFQENPYQETPILRGLFFSSGRQEGSPYSHFLKALGLIEEREVLPGTSKGLFLHDFFSRILPRDRGLFAPTRRRREWMQLTRNLGLTSWVAVVFAICGLLSFSFAKNLKTLRDVSHKLSTSPALQGEILEDIPNMDRFRTAISELEDRNRGWWIPRFGLNESKNVEAQLKSKYCTQFKEGLLVAFDKQMTENMTDFSNSTPVDVIVPHVDHLVKRIGLLRARLEGGSLESLKTAPQPSYEPIALMGGQKLIPEIRQMYASLYLHFLAWHEDKSGFNKEINDLKRTWLKHVLSTRDNLHWLVDWVNTNPSFSPLTLADFWGGSLTALDETDLPAAFTQDGKKRIGSFLEEIESALGDDRLIIASQKLEFQKWYRQAYVGAWRDFGAIFPKGADRLEGKAEWENVAATIATDQGPYFKFLDTMAEELKPIASGIDLPAWIDLVYYLKAARLQAVKLGASKEKGALARFKEKGEKLIEKMEEQGGKIAGGTTLESRLIAARAFREYQDALAQIVPSSASRTAAYGMAADVFKEDPLTSTSPFLAAQKAITKLRTSLEKVKSDEKMFWNLVTGPLDYLWAFFCQETACQLQHLWEKEVLWEVRGVSDELVKNQLLLGSEGYARKFIDGPAEPFIGVSLRRALHQREALGRKIDFEDAFLTFLKGGTPQPAPQPGRSHYIIAVKGFPTDADTRGQVLPHATELEVQCGAEPLRLINYGYGEKSFKWLPQSCGDVILKIRVADLVLTRRYSGNLAFPEFLQDFARGERTFYPRDFPKEEANLRPLGIKSITVHYEFSGHQRLLKYYRSVIALRKKMARVPERIAKCWDQ